TEGKAHTRQGGYARPHSFHGSSGLLIFQLAPATVQEVVYPFGQRGQAGRDTVTHHHVGLRVKLKSRYFDEEPATFVYWPVPAHIEPPSVFVGTVEVGIQFGFHQQVVIATPPDDILDVEEYG